MGLSIALRISKITNSSDPDFAQIWVKPYESVWEGWKIGQRCILALCITKKAMTDLFVLFYFTSNSQSHAICRGYHIFPLISKNIDWGRGKWPYYCCAMLILIINLVLMEEKHYVPPGAIATYCYRTHWYLGWCFYISLQSSIFCTSRFPSFLKLFFSLQGM